MPHGRHPLYEPRFEHDACGIGFVADAGGRSADRVLPLALAGLAALGHRGAFAADGASSDGAGITLPLDPAVLGHLAPGVADRPGVVQVFLPPGRRAREQARRLIEAALDTQRLQLAGWREVPTDTSVLGASAAASRPHFAQAIVLRPARPDLRPWSDDAFDRALVLARRHAQRDAAERGIHDLTIASASCRTVVYKGLVTGAALPRLFPDLAQPLCVRSALFHQRYATNTHPTWSLAQPFRWLAHNGEINTVRGNRVEVAGRAADTNDALMRAVRTAGPLIDPAGSDSLSLDELVELLVMSGWSLGSALLAAIPEAGALRRSAHPLLRAFRRRTAGFIAPWDGPAAIVFSDGRRIGALVDRNGLRPCAYATTDRGLVAVASEAGAIPLEPVETVTRGRLAPGELLLVDPARRRILHDAEAKESLLRRFMVHGAPRVAHTDGALQARKTTPPGIRYLHGLDAERLRLDLRTMAIDGHEPLWSMGDDTPTPARARIDRRAVDHLRQAFAQVTNPAIDPERELLVLDLRVELGRRAGLLRGIPRRPLTIQVPRPIVADLDGLLGTFAHHRGLGRVRRIDTTWPGAEGPDALERALERLAATAVRAARGRTELLVLDDRGATLERPPIPSVLAAGAVHTALVRAGLRGRTDIAVEAGDVLDAHAMAMLLAAGATVVRPWLALETAAEIEGSRGADDLSPGDAVERLLEALAAGLRKTLARMGISAVASYVGAGLVDSLELAPEVVARCFPSAAAWPGTIGLGDLAERQLRRAGAAGEVAAKAAAPVAPLPNGHAREIKLPDPGRARFRADGEVHLFAPRVVGAIQSIAGARHDSLDAYRAAMAGEPATVRDDLRIRRRRRPLPLAEVEDAHSIARRFVASAMSVGALSPEAHQAVTIGVQRAGGAANTGEGGEDPAWYRHGLDGERRDARIKQVASARFGVTATYLARGEQLEIKIAQGSKPGEGGQLPGRKATAFIASLRRAQPGQSLISPPPHHDIYSIEDLAQLIADLRAINPQARVGVKLVSSRGVGTIAAGVAKAGADYIHLAGHAGGTGASPLSSIKHAGAPWELGLAETHQVLLRNDLRDRVALRVDGGLRTGRDLLVAALLGAEEFAFGTSLLVALGCDMARQCHLDTCPTGIATQREDLRAKFTGSPDQVERFVLALAEDLRRELAAIGARSVGDVVGDTRHLRARADCPLDLRALLGATRWAAASARRSRPQDAGRAITRAPASALEAGLVRAFRGQAGFSAAGLRVTNADRSFGAGLAGALERGEVHGPIRLKLEGSAGQSFGAFAPAGLELRLTGQANDYLAKGLSGGTVVVAPEPDLAAPADQVCLAGNTCLYGATAGRVHVLGAAGMRFAVRNSGATAVVEGLGPHGAEYMTGGVLVVLGPVGANLGGGMTGGRVFVHDPAGDLQAAINPAFVQARRLASVADRPDTPDRLTELVSLLIDHREAGSGAAARLLDEPARLAHEFWLVEPVAAAVTAAPDAARDTEGRTGAIPDRNLVAAEPVPTVPA
jgi:glutamate synthase domain-containing protein 2/glutamate synthase domain-containing protein 1/glutamate synthase domain-containing protein 3